MQCDWTSRSDRARGKGCTDLALSRVTDWRVACPAQVGGRRSQHPHVFWRHSALQADENGAVENIWFSPYLFILVFILAGLVLVSAQDSGDPNPPALFPRRQPRLTTSVPASWPPHIRTLEPSHLSSSLFRDIVPHGTTLWPGSCSAGV
jgi:hypothetical protein